MLVAGRPRPPLFLFFPWVKEDKYSTATSSASPTGRPPRSHPGRFPFPPFFLLFSNRLKERTRLVANMRGVFFFFLSSSLSHRKKNSPTAETFPSPPSLPGEEGRRFSRYPFSPPSTDEYDVPLLLLPLPPRLAGKIDRSSGSFSLSILFLFQPGQGGRDLPWEEVVPLPLK